FLHYLLLFALMVDANCISDRSLSHTELRCPGNDWYEFGEFCYKAFDEKKTWHAARSECRRLGADLVSIMSLTEQSWLETTNDVWTGLNDLDFSGYFTWSDHHEVTFTYWSPGEPNNHLDFNEDCVEMYYQNGTSFWNDINCEICALR
uniref:C-type lectin domain-containing protein n=1 Tax=Pygocentrus nattereri TaxID=42514 RepID=A0AAR2JFM0_PYGNA